MCPDGPPIDLHGVQRQDAGYTHVNLDDCWAEKNRTSDGSLAPSMSPCHFCHLSYMVILIADNIRRRGKVPKRL